MSQFILYTHRNTVSDIMCDVSEKYTKRRGQITPNFLNLYFEFRDKKYTDR